MEDIKCGKGIMNYINSANPTPINYNIIWKEVEDTLKKLDEQSKKREKNKDLRIKNNLKELTKKSKELGKEIPDHLLVVIYTEQPQRSWFFEKYKEWFE